MRTSFRFLCALVAISAAGWVAKADPFSGSTSAAFGTPGPAGTVSSGIGTNQLTTGTGQPNVLTMTSKSFTNVAAGTAFAVSDLSYFNGQTNAGSSATSLPVTLTIHFTNPAGLDQAFNFTYNLDITSNNYVPLSDPRNNDTLTVPVVFPTETFTDAGNTYTLELLGFSTDGGATIVSTFSLPETATANATLYGEITAPPPPSSAPLPTTAWAGLAILGSLGVFQYARSRKSAVV